MKTIFEQLEKWLIYFVLYGLICMCAALIVTELNALTNLAIVSDNILGLHAVLLKTNLLIIISLLIVLIGCVLTLKGIDGAFKLNFENSKLKSNLESSSPGLIMVTLGCSLLALSVSKSISLTSKIDELPGGPKSKTFDISGITSHVAISDIHQFETVQYDTLDSTDIQYMQIELDLLKGKKVNPVDLSIFYGEACQLAMQSGRYIRLMSDLTNVDTIKKIMAQKNEDISWSKGQLELFTGEYYQFHPRIIDKNIAERFRNCSFLLPLN